MLKDKAFIGARLGHAEVDHGFDGASEQGQEPEVAESSLVPLLRVSGLKHPRERSELKTRERGRKGKGREGKAMVSRENEQIAKRRACFGEFGSTTCLI